MTSQLPPDLPEHDNALRTGVRLGEFEIVDVIGVGGFGIVYRAFDHDLEREVAIKEYMPGQFAGRDATGAVTVRARTHAETFGIGLRSFVNEARLLARFDHPALLKVYRYWEANGTAYMAMPFYDGSTLSQVVRGLPGPPSQAWLMGVIEPLLGALELLHGQHIFHRDISPDNILLLDDGHPVLLDFGAARRVIGDRTQTLTAILKPNYAPIEQYAEIPGLKQGPWTDLYALGAVVYACLTGKPPSPAATRAVLDDLVPLDQLGQQLQQHHNLHFDAGFLAAWQATLAVKPADRVQNIAQLRALLAGGVDPANDPERTLIKVPAPAAAAPASPVADDDDPERTVVRVRPSPTVAPTAAATPASVAAAPQATPASPAKAPVARPVVKPAVAAAPTPAPSAQASHSGQGRTIGLIAAVMLIGAGATYWALQRNTAPAARPPAYAAAASAPAVSEPTSAAASPTASDRTAAVAVAEVALPASDLAPGREAVAAGSAAPVAAPSVSPLPAAVAEASAAGAAPSARNPASAAVPRTKPVSKAVANARHPASAPAATGSVGPASAAPGGSPRPVAESASVAVSPPVSSGTATEVCGKHFFIIAMDNCMNRECKKPQYETKSDCFRYLSQERQEQLRGQAK
ncbi:MAG: serine/threonine protein kinase [Leptothrix sp. (in: b-proteobacteria)]